MFDKFREFFVGVSHSVNLTRTTFIDGDNVYFPPLNVSFYFAMRQNLFDGVPDDVLALATPGVAYWSTSLFFYYIDASRWTWLCKYQIHESDETKSRKCAT